MSIENHIKRFLLFFTDVVGIIHKRDPLRYITNRLNEVQTFLDLIIRDTV